jgi:hypothetical protein
MRWKISLRNCNFISYVDLFSISRVLIFDSPFFVHLNCSHRGYFVDLYVRKSNALAIGMYKKFGYSIYREVIGYYTGEENAYGIVHLNCLILMCCNSLFFVVFAFQLRVGRHEESLIARCSQKVHNSTASPSSSR